MDVAIRRVRQSLDLALLTRALGVCYGFATQLLFFYTVWYLFWFMRDGASNGVIGDPYLVNTGLAILFALTHSVMLVPKCRRWLSRWISSAFYDSTFCVATCMSLLILFAYWQTSLVVVWDMHGMAFEVIRGSFYLSWVALVYSLALTGLGHQTGWTPFYYWLLKRKMPPRQFKPRGAYRLIRHPVYLSFLGLLWSVPLMSLDRFVLCLIWTTYIFYGSFLKDRRLIHFIGEPYRAYQEAVVGYPLMFFGPLAKRKRQDVIHSMDESVG